ncbi:hypothetical protein KQX54_021742 [Cotesia glomerata]|uniref:Uncharacterized protein n=1 Tax=Cotesia glomerata TaxID=32391 RepID=A0AAV7J954_COTGL|nr:hypothetical protein KQX54_021742 [Cotesia glomerata]
MEKARPRVNGGCREFAAERYAENREIAGSPKGIRERWAGEGRKFPFGRLGVTAAGNPEEENQAIDLGLVFRSILCWSETNERSEMEPFRKRLTKLMGFVWLVGSKEREARSEERGAEHIYSSIVYYCIEFFREQNHCERSLTRNRVASMRSDFPSQAARFLIEAGE